MLSSAEATELADLFEVTFQDNAADSVLWATNKTGADITVTIEMTELNNVSPAEGQKVTLTVPGHAKVAAIHLTPVDENQRYRHNFAYHFTWGSTRARHDPATVYALPYSSGATFKVVQGFHGKFSHAGELA